MRSPIEVGAEEKGFYKPIRDPIAIESRALIAELEKKIEKEKEPLHQHHHHHNQTQQYQTRWQQISRSHKVQRRMSFIFSIFCRSDSIFSQCFFYTCF